MEITLNQVKAIFAEIAEKHKQINGFHWGDFLDAVSGEEPAEYPLLVCTQRPAPFGSQFMGINLLCSAWDKYNEDDQAQLDDVFSDMLQFVDDLKNILLSYRLEDYIAVTISSNYTPYKHKGQDIVAGYEFLINLEIHSDPNYCGIPIDDSFEFLERGKDLTPN